MKLKYFRMNTCEDFKRFTQKECIIYFLLYTFIPISPIYYAFLTHHYFIFLNAIIVFSLFSGANAVMPFIVRKFNCSDFSNFHIGSPYQDGTKTFPMFAPSFFAICIFCGYYFNNMIGGLCAALLVTAPLIILFFRSEVFNDNSCIIENEIVFGYHTGFYIAFDFLLALICISLILKGYLNEYIVITTLFIQIIVLFPEKVNYFFPCEIRTKKGFILFFSTLMAFYLIVLFILFSIFEYSFQINLVQNINLFSIAKIGFFIVSSLIIFKWYKKKYH